MTKIQDPAEHADMAPASHEDDLIVVPKGRSRLLFFFTLAIMLFVLFIFTVGDDVVRSFSGQQGGQGSDVFMKWKTPVLGDQQLSRMDFVLEKRKLAPLKGGDFPDDQLAYWIVLDDLAREAGIAVTDEEVKDAILGFFGSAEGYDRFIQFQRGLTKKTFEETLRRDLRVARYAGLVTAAARPVDPTEIERRWKGRHQEYRFEYVSQPVADMVEAAGAEVPDDAALEAYYGALYDYQKQEYKLSAEVRAEVVTLSLEGELDEVRARGEKLLAAWPGEAGADPTGADPADPDPEGRARAYYEGFAYVRFRKENPDLSNIDPSKGFGPELFQKPYAEVEEQAQVEAPLYDAFVAWNTSLNERLGAGEAVDLAQEAAELGLDYMVTNERLTLDDWKERYPKLGRIADQLAQFTASGSVTPAPVVGESTIAIGRPLDKIEARQPEFAEIRDKVAESWTLEHAGKLATQKLDKLRDGFGERPEPPLPFRPEATSEKFAEVATAAGYEVQVREWRDRFDRPEDPTPAEEFFQSSSNLYTLREDAVGEPGFDSAKELAFLARVDGIRDPELKNLDLAEIQGLERSASQDALVGFGTRTFNSRAFMQERYGLWLESWNEAGE